MIGNETYANIVAALPTEWATSFNDDTGEYLHTPEGFRFLGCGAYRMAFLGPDGVVYKREFFDDTHCNEGEAAFYITAPEVDGFRFAACALLGDVLAMEYVEDDGSECWDSADKAAKWMREMCGYSDVAGKHGYNWFGVNGVCVITDYSYGWDE
jgi:hypothetical protein